VPSGCTTGYGIDPAGHKFCFDCCANRDRDSMRSNGDAVLYLVKDQVNGNWLVTNWPASLHFGVCARRVGRHNMGRERVDVLFHGSDGRVWHGGPDDNGEAVLTLMLPTED